MPDPPKLDRSTRVNDVGGLRSLAPEIERKMLHRRILSLRDLVPVDRERCACGFWREKIEQSAWADLVECAAWED